MKLQLQLHSQHPIPVRTAAVNGEERAAQIDRIQERLSRLHQFSQARGRSRAHPRFGLLVCRHCSRSRRRFRPSVQEADDFLDARDVIRQPRFHRGRHAERLMLASDVLLHEVYGHRRAVILQFLRECVGEPGAIAAWKSAS